MLIKFCSTFKIMQAIELMWPSQQFAKNCIQEIQERKIYFHLD